VTPDSRHALRRVLSVWLTVALVELALWWVLYRSRFYRPLHLIPAVIVLVAGVLGTLQALRRRRRDRRAGDRRDTQSDDVRAPDRAREPERERDRQADR
jgi:type VI protein secretion system component VasK